MNIQLKLPWCRDCGAYLETYPKPRAHFICPACKKAKHKQWMIKFKEQFGIDYSTYRARGAGSFASHKRATP